MDYAYRYRAYPDKTGVTPIVERQRDIHRQAYNYTKYEYENHKKEPTVGSAYKHQDRLPDWKTEFLSEVHSKALQKTVERFYKNLSNLKDKKNKGYKVGALKWKSPRDYQSFTYSQSGFELKNTSGPDTNATLWLSKIGDISIEYHRPIPDHATIKEVTVKKETTGEWYVSFSLETDDENLPDNRPQTN